MITGVVQGLEARIRLRVCGPGGCEKEIDAVIDTGYTSSLSLTPALVRSLGLPWDEVGKGTLADGSVCIYDIYQATVVWDRKVIPIFIDEIDSEPLVGMSLLDGFELRVEVRPQGKVIIKRLRR